MTSQQQRFSHAAKVCKVERSPAARRRCMSAELKGSRGGRYGYVVDDNSDGGNGFASPMGRRHRGGRSKRRKYHGGLSGFDALSRQHYTEVASILRRSGCGAAIDDFVRYFQADNPRFNASLFRKAAS